MTLVNGANSGRELSWGVQWILTLGVNGKCIKAFSFLYEKKKNLNRNKSRNFSKNIKKWRAKIIL